MSALAKDSTLQSMLESMTGYTPERTASVREITFKGSQFEAGGINNSTGQNQSESGFYRTKEYIEVPANKWKIQLYAEKPFGVNIYYYNENKEYQERDNTKTGYCNIKDYPYCRIKVYLTPGYISDIADFVENCIRIQYIESAPAENEYFLHNQLFNGNFEFDRNEDGVADVWALRNSPASYSVEDGVQSVTPSTEHAFLRYEIDNRLMGHVIYCSITAYTPYGICGFSVYGTTPCIVQQNTEFTRASGLVTAANTSLVAECSCPSSSIGHEIQVKNIMLIDLTDIFGEGNEPTVADIDAIVDQFYNGYVPCEYTVKYDDSDLPVSIMDRLKHIDTSSDQLTVKNGEVASVLHYVGSELKSKTIINRDRFGNLISVEEVQQ